MQLRLLLQHAGLFAWIAPVLFGAERLNGHKAAALVVEGEKAAAAQSANCPAAVEGAARNLILEALENISAYDPADYAAEPAQPDR